MATVLLVEDEPDHLELMTFFLGTHGHDVVAAGTGEEAMLLIERCTYAVAIVDLGLPSAIDGIQVILRIRLKSAELPIVVVTAYSDKSTIDAAVRAGANLVFTKPVPDWSALASTITAFASPL